MRNDVEGSSSPRHTYHIQWHTGGVNGLGAGEADGSEKHRERSEGAHDALWDSVTNLVNDMLRICKWERIEDTDVIAKLTLSMERDDGGEQRQFDELKA